MQNGRTTKGTKVFLRVFLILFLAVLVMCLLSVWYTYGPSGAVVAADFEERLVSQIGISVPVKVLQIRRNRWCSRNLRRFYVECILEYEIIPMTQLEIVKENPFFPRAIRLEVGKSYRFSCSELTYWRQGVLSPWTVVLLGSEMRPFDYWVRHGRTQGPGDQPSK